MSHFPSRAARQAPAVPDPHGGSDAVPSGRVESIARRAAEDMRRRWEGGDRPRAEGYFDQHPELLLRPECALDVLYEEVQLRQDHGEGGVWSDVCRRFPQWDRPLRSLRECHELIDTSPVPPDFPGVGQTVGGFRLVAELARGAHGRVFVATQSALADRPLVVKLTPRTGQEHLSLARLQHTSIVPLYSAHDDPERGLRVLCMPYFGGATLVGLSEALAGVPPEHRTGRHLIDALDRLAAPVATVAPPVTTPRHFLRRLNFAQTVCWIAAVCAEALHYAHERGVLHLDVKPSNILIAADGQPMLLDFHLARAPIRPDEVAPECLGGTFAYMAPEHRRGVEAVGTGRPVPVAVDGRADVYGLGSVVYEALGGTVPVRAPAPPLYHMNTQVSVGLSDVIAKSLAPDPNQRYADAAAFAADLRRHLADLPLVGVANRSPRERWRKWRRRRAAGIRLGVVVALGALAVGGPALGYAAHVSASRERAERAVLEGVAQSKERGHHDEAVATLRGGLALAEELPIGADLKRRLREALVEAERAQTAARHESLLRDLRAQVERLRGLYGAKLPPNDPSRALLESCRVIWENRLSIRAHLGAGRHPELDTDLLDLAVLWTGLRADLAADPAADRRDALRVLDEAEALCGPSPVLAYERQCVRRVLGAGADAGFEVPRPHTAWEEYALGRSLLRAGEPARAAEYLGRAVALQPAACWPNYYFGVAALRLGRFEEATAALSVCIGSAPDLAAAYYNRAQSFAARERSESAIRDYTHALQLAPGLADAWINRGVLHFRSNRPAAAIADFERALELGTRRADAHYDLALVYLAGNDRAAARSHLRSALADDPNHTDSAELLKTLAADR
ncbi:tetratricopeptide repeat protein [Frigoriglobus tundricola]|uniref:Protein kinase domain-containing protein n=1 Tax=Frigoriglobus tundricola TaxID=2774151 RepID=A0A6M5Z611_9BACT|nr:serine/threonine-protein kinase [Frigoriglobus tundricola]QJX01297.1 hypothetical protein FTUN_8939 [Frigoriglobus tundricola]